YLTSTGDCNQTAYPQLYAFPTRRSSDLSAISCTEYSGIETGAAAGARGLRPGLRAGFQPASQKLGVQPPVQPWPLAQLLMGALLDRKSTRLNSSHVKSTYADFSS